MTDSTAASAIWGGFRAVVAVGVAAAGLTVVLGPGVARSVNRAFSLLSLRLGFMMIRPRPTAAAREAFFAKIEDNYARRKQGQPLPSPPPSHFPVEEESTHATLMPADENVFLELMAGIRVPTAHFNLPFTAADGRQTFIAIPGSYIPTYFPGTGPTGINVYSFWGLETPDAAYGPVIYLPDQPHYTPARDGQPAMLFDGHSGWVSLANSVTEARVGGMADTHILAASLRPGRSSLLPVRESPTG